MKKYIQVKDAKILIISKETENFLCLTDMIRTIPNGLSLIEKWIRNKNTIEFLGEWEKLYNKNFNSTEFEGIKNEAGTNRFLLSIKQWISKTNSIGITAKSGRYGGTYAHEDIALEFASWISPQFKLYLIKEFRRLKEEENSQYKLGWNIKRTLTKINYQIHTDAVKENLIPLKITSIQASEIYASEADILNLALFSKTAKDWKSQHKDKKGNIRDFANISQLICLSNLESINSIFIKEGVEQSDRLIKLNKIAISQMKILTQDKNIKRLGGEK